MRNSNDDDDTYPTILSPYKHISYLGKGAYGTVTIILI